MAIDQSQRPRFYEGQYLGARDLTAIVEEQAIHEARHILGAHTWGIAFGLDLTEVPSPQGGGQVDVFVVPGYGWDGFGRTIAVLAPYKIPAEKFKACVFDPTIDGGIPPGRLIPIWLRYREVAVQPPLPGFAVCGQDDQTSRVQETFDLIVGDLPLSGQRDHISIAGRSVDAQDALKAFDPQAPSLYDTAVPDQTFPEQDPTANWLIPLGAVRWLPNTDPTLPGQFVQTTPDDRKKGLALRRFVGAVAEAIQAPAGRLRLKARAKAPSSILSDDLAWVEGTLRVDDDVKLFGGKLDFRTTAGQDQGIPLNMQRAINTLGGQDIQVIIGRDSAGHNRLSVGPLTGSPGSQTCDVKLVIQDDGRVGIGTLAPGFKLDVADRMRVRQGGSGSAGIWFYQTGPGTDRAFVGMAADDQVGFWGNTGANWGLVMNTATGRVGIGTTSSPSKLEIDGDVALRQMPPGAPRALAAGETLVWNDGTWLRLNQNLDYTKPIFGVHTPGVFAPLSLNVGGASAWGDPGAGNVWVTGNVGIGTTNLGGRLMITGPNALQGNLEFFAQFGDIVYDGGSDGLFIITDAGGTTAFMGGNIGVGTIAPQAKLHVQGDLYISGHARKGDGHFWWDLSDARLKKNVKPLTDALSQLLRLRGVFFEWAAPEEWGRLSGRHMGLVAQEVEKVFPEWVSTGAHGYKEMTPKGLEALIVEALRELKADAGEAEARLGKCEKLIDTLQKSMPPRGGRERPRG